MSKSPKASRHKAAKTPDTVAPSLPAQTDFDLHIPLLSRAIFWRPRHLAASPDLAALPSLYWLLEAIEPARSLQIGLGDGVAYLSLCQAIDKLGLEASVTGLEPREGMAALPPKMAEQHRLAYRDFSYVIATDPAQLAPRMTSSELDLLVINCPLDAPLTEALSAHFLPQLSARSVIVVLNPQQNVSSPEAQALLQAHMNQGQSVTCDYGDTAMLVILHGPSQPDRLRRFAALNHNEPSFLAAMQIFRRLGDALVQEWQVIEHESQARANEREIAQLKDMIANGGAGGDKFKAEIAAAVAGERQQAAQLAQVQARLFDANEAIAKSADLSHRLDASLLKNKQDQAAHADEIQRLTQSHAKALGEAREKLHQTEAQHTADRAAHSAVMERAEAAERDLAQERSSPRSSGLEAQYKARVEDIIALTAAHKSELKKASEQNEALQKSFDEAQNARKRNWAALEALKPQLKADKERIAALTRALQEQHRVFEQEKRALMDSTSWKVTKPLRGIGNSLRRNK